MAGGPQPYHGTVGGLPKSGTHGKYRKYSADTRWALVKYGSGKRWIRVGSPTWNQLHKVAQIQSTTVKPLKFTRSSWNPMSPQYRKANANSGQGQAQHGAPDAIRNKQKNDPKNPNNTGNKPGSGKGPKGNKNSKGPKTGGAQYGKYLGNPNVNKMIPLKSADKIAGMQYDAAIKSLKRQITTTGIQNDDNVKQLREWYQAAEQQNQKAGNDNAKAFQAGAQLADNTTAFLNQGGLHQEGGNDMLNAQADSSAAMFKQLGAVDAAFHNNAEGILTQGGADSVKREQNRAGTQMGDLNSQLQGALAQRGAAKVAAIQSIIQANNAARQANYGNRTSKIGTIASMLQLGQNLQIGALNIKKAQQETGSGSGHKKFDTYNPAEQDQLVANWVGRGDAGHANKSHAQAIKTLQAQGFSITNPHIQQFLATYYTPNNDGTWSIIR